MTYKVQIDDLVRNATLEEIAVIEAQQSAEAARIAARQQVAVAKISARAKLAALGLTDEEIAALVG